MTPIYRTFLHTPEPRRLRPGRWTWEVGDGYLATLGAGIACTRWGAYRARDRFAGTCRSQTEAALGVLRAALGEVVARLHTEGIDVEARLDRAGRVCVRACCPTADRRRSDRAHRRAVAEICRAVGRPVLWWAGSTGTEVQPQGQATVATNSAARWTGAVQ